MTKIEFDNAANGQKATVAFTAEIDPASGAVTLDGEKLPPESITYLLTYGLKQAMNDPMAVGKIDGWDSPEAYMAERERKLKARVEALKSGDMTARRGGGARKSPLDTMMETVAEQVILNAAQAKGKTLTKKALGDLVKQLITDPEKSEKIEAEAKKRLSAKTTAIDVGDLV